MIDLNGLRPANVQADYTTVTIGGPDRQYILSFCFVESYFEGAVRAGAHAGPAGGAMRADLQTGKRPSFELSRTRRRFAQQLSRGCNRSAMVQSGLAGIFLVLKGQGAGQGCFTA